MGSRVLPLVLLILSCGSGSPATAPGPTPDGGTGTSPQKLTPCARAVCWEPSAEHRRCGYHQRFEDFSSGRFNVHRYAATLHERTKATIRLSRTGGTWQPALVVTTTDGTVLFDGTTVGASSPAMVTVVSTGETGESAELVVDLPGEALGVYVFVTAWEVLRGGYSPFLPTDATYRLLVQSDCGETSADGIAPAGTLPDESLVSAPELEAAIQIGTTAWGPPLRFDARAGEYLGFQLDFAPGATGVEMEVLRFNGTEAVSLGVTDGGDGIRTLAALDPDGPRTFWVRARGGPVESATLRITRTDFPEGSVCPSDCGRLLQLPLPNDPLRDGYGMPPSVIYRYQFGRRDLLMFMRHAGRALARAGIAPYTVRDLSRWDGDRPPGHQTHTQGIHADVSLYDESGAAVWRSLCTVDANSECVPGTDNGFGEYYVARFLAPLFESGRIIWALLDREFHPSLRREVESMVANGELDPALEHFYSADDNIVRHVRIHHHHIHLAVSTN